MWLFLVIFLIIPCQCFANIYSVAAFNAAHNQVQDNERSSADIDYQRIKNEEAQKELEYINNNDREQELANAIKSNPNAFNIERIPGKFYDDGSYVSEHYVVTAKSN